MSMGAQQVLQSHPSRYRSSTGVSGKHLTAAEKTAAFMRLRLCRAAYQCMTTVVVCTQRLEKFYCDLLFKEDSHVLWDNLVDDVTPFDSLPFPVEPTFANGVCVCVFSPPSPHSFAYAGPSASGFYCPVLSFSYGCLCFLMPTPCFICLASARGVFLTPSRCPPPFAHVVAPFCPHANAVRLNTRRLCTSMPTLDASSALHLRLQQGPKSSKAGTTGGAFGSLFSVLADSQMETLKGSSLQGGGGLSQGVRSRMLLAARCRLIEAVLGQVLLCLCWHMRRRCRDNAPQYPGSSVALKHEHSCTQLFLLMHRGALRAP